MTFEQLALALAAVNAVYGGQTVEAPPPVPTEQTRTITEIIENENGETQMNSHMNTALRALTGATLCTLAVGCSTLNKPGELSEESTSKLVVDKEVPPLTRMEVINGINECEAAGLRPIVLSARRRVNNTMVPSVIEVTCLPRIK